MHNRKKYVFLIVETGTGTLHQGFNDKALTMARCRSFFTKHFACICYIGSVGGQGEDGGGVKRRQGTPGWALYRKWNEEEDRLNPPGAPSRGFHSLKKLATLNGIWKFAQWNVLHCNHALFFFFQFFFTSIIFFLFLYRIVNNDETRKKRSRIGSKNFNNKLFSRLFVTWIKVYRENPWINHRIIRWIDNKYEICINSFVTILITIELYLRHELFSKLNFNWFFFK